MIGGLGTGDRPLAEEPGLETVMQLFIKIIPLRAGTAEPAGQPRIIACPAGLEPDTILSFLTQQLGQVTETIWTSTGRHERIDAGWVFPAPGAAGPQDGADIACVPLIQSAGGLQPMFEAQADQRQALGPGGRQPRPGLHHHPAAPPPLPAGQAAHR